MPAMCSGVAIWWRCEFQQEGARMTETVEEQQARHIAALEAAISWGYVRAGNAYKRPPPPKKPEPIPLDVATDDAPHG